MGPVTAAVRIDLFSDFECPACKALHEQTVTRIKEDFARPGKVRFVHHDFPLPQHKQARRAATLAAAADKLGKFDAVADALFKQQETWSKTGTVDDVVEAATGIGRGNSAPSADTPLPASFRRPPAGRWYVRVANAEIPASQLADTLVAHRLPVRDLIECGRALVGRTTETPWSIVGPAVDALRAAGFDVLALPFVVRT